MGEVRQRLTWGDLGQLFDGPHATPTRREDGPYFLNISSLKAGRLDLSESDHVSEDDFAKWTRRVTPQRDDLLFSYETRLGEAALMPAGVRACLGRRMALLRPNRDVVDPRFLLYFYLSPVFQRLIEKHTVHGATVPRIGLASMPDWEVELPPLAEQRAIAEVLGALDDKIAANDRVIGKADELARMAFRKAAGSLSPAATTLGELASTGALSLGDGYRTKRTELAETGYRIVRAGDVARGRVSFDGPDFVDADFRDKIGSKLVRPGDVVLTTKGTVGRVAVVPEKIEAAVYSPQLCFFRVTDRDQLDPGYLAGWFMSDDLQSQAEQRMYKSDMAPYVNLQDIRSLSIPLPSMDVQAEIGRQQSDLRGMIERLQLENRRLTLTRDALLPLLMSGKLRVKDAEELVSCQV